MTLAFPLRFFPALLTRGEVSAAAPLLNSCSDGRSAPLPPP